MNDDIRAIRVRRHNRHDVKRFASGRLVRLSWRKMLLRTPQQNLVLHYGDWLVKNERGQFQKMTNRELKNEYVRIF